MSLGFAVEVLLFIFVVVVIVWAISLFAGRIR